jgi:hypothetical protein
MSVLAGISGDTRNKAIAVAVFVLIGAGFLYYQLAGGTPNPAANAPAVATPAASARAQDAAGGTDSASSAAAAGAARPVAGGNAARKIGGSSAALDPALRMDAMLASESVEYSGVGRNIFSPNSAPPVAIPKPVASVRPQPVPVPCPPNCPRPPGPPPPPPIDLTFFGTETDAAGVLQAILLHQDAVYTAKAGDVVLRRYRIVTINAKSIQVEDMVTNNKQTLVMVAN